jgi:beta-RFAP synthase
MEAFPRQPGHAKSPTRRREAIVTATARLHFGFLDPSGRSARPFGSFGLSLDRPRTRLVLSRAQRFAVSGPEGERAERYLREIGASCGIEETYALRIEEAIPPHAGLGSGTQLALAVGSAFAALEGIRLEPQEIAARLGRGTRSGIGIATFARGGAVLDEGPREGNLPRLASRVPFPHAWRVLLIFDEET